MLVRKTLYAFLTPPNIFFIIIFFSCIFFYKRKARRAIIVSTLLFAVLSTPIVADRLHAYLNKYPTITVSQIQAYHAQAIVLLSGGIDGYSKAFGNYMPNANSILRAIYANHLAQQTQLPILISGGGKRDNSPAGATIINNFIQQNFNLTAKWLETKSHTTFENALYTQAILSNHNIKRVVLVTESWHMRRAVTVFKNYGFEVLPAPAFASVQSYEFNFLDKLIPNAQAFKRSQTALHEIIGIAWYKLEFLLRN